MRAYNFTAGVRSTLAKAREEAGRLHHGYVGTEHLALALLRQSPAAVPPILATLDRDALIAELERRAGGANEPAGMGPDRPYTSASKRVLELAMESAAERRDEAVGTSHLLFGILREERGVGGQVLREAGLAADAVHGSRRPTVAPVVSADAMRFQIDPLPGETRRAAIAIARASLPPSRRSAIMIGLYAVVVMLAFVLTPNTRPQTIVIGVGAILATEALLRWESNRRLRQLQADDLHALETHHVELSASGVRAWCEHVDLRYPWSDYRRVVQSPEFHLLLRAGGSGTAIPKRLLDAECTRELEARLTAWLPSAP